MNWFKGGWSGSVFVNYIGEYTLTVDFIRTSGTNVPACVAPLCITSQDVDAFITGDLSIGYSFADAGVKDGPLSGVRVLLNVNNFTDEHPPIALLGNNSVGPNHDGLGRFYRISLSKAF